MRVIQTPAKARSHRIRKCLISTLAGIIIAIANPVLAQCNVSASGVNFGTYDPFAGLPVDSTGTVTVSCLLSLGYSVAVSEGNSGSFLSRTLISGGNILNYNLYTDVTHSTILGDGSGGTSTITGSIGLLLLPVDHFIFGRMPGGQNPAAGSYSDTLNVTVTY